MQPTEPVQNISPVVDSGNSGYEPELSVTRVTCGHSIGPIKGIKLYNSLEILTTHDNGSLLVFPRNINAKAVTSCSFSVSEPSGRSAMQQKGD